MPDQLTRADLASMTPEEIQAARRSGRLNALLSQPEATVDDIVNVMQRQAQEPASADSTPPTDDQPSREDLTGMTPAAIVQAKRDGLLNALLGRSTLRPTIHQGLGSSHCLGPSSPGGGSHEHLPASPLRSPYRTPGPLPGPRHGVGPRPAFTTAANKPVRLRVAAARHLILNGQEYREGDEFDVDDAATFTWLRTGLVLSADGSWPEGLTTAPGAPPGVGGDPLSGRG